MAQNFSRQQRPSPMAQTESRILARIAMPIAATNPMNADDARS
jgi:hypothetical protein